MDTVTRTELKNIDQTVAKHAFYMTGKKGSMLKYFVLAVLFFAAPVFSQDIDPTKPPYNLIVNDGLDDTAALDAAFADAKALKENIILPAGVINLTINSPKVWDFTPLAYSGFSFVGDGLGKTQFALSSTMTSGVLWTWTSDADWYDINLEGLSFHGSFDGVLMQFGKDNFQDPLNVLTMKRVGFFNSKVGSNVEALRLNYVVNSHLDSVRANGFSNGSGGNYGKALHCRQCQFTTHTNFSYGNAAYGAYFSGGASDTNWFINGDVENIVYGFYNASANSGLHEILGTRISLWQAYAVSAPIGRSGSRFSFTRPSLGPLPGKTTFVDPAGASGINITW